MTSLPNSLGGFEIKHEIDQNGLCSYHKCYPAGTDFEMVIKTLRPELADDSDARKHFQQEVDVIHGLGHPGLVQIFASGEEDGILYTVLQKIDGITLQQVLDGSGRLSLGRSLLVIEKIIEIINATWEQSRLTHNSLKPDTIYLTGEDQVVLGDLSLASSIQTQEANAANTVFGAPEFIAPERLMGKTADYRSDIYSLGVTLYYVLCGHFPYAGRDSQEIAQRHLDTPLTSLNKTLPDIPPAISQLVSIMLAKRPEHRHNSLMELIADLMRVQNGEMPEMAPPPKAQKPLIKSEGQQRIECAKAEIANMSSETSPEDESETTSDPSDSNADAPTNSEPAASAQPENITPLQAFWRGFLEMLGFKHRLDAHSNDKHSTSANASQPDKEVTKAPETPWWDVTHQPDMTFTNAVQPVFETIDSHTLFVSLQKRLSSGETVVIDMPENVQRVIQILNSGKDFDYGEIVPLINRSPGLTGAILRIANSAAFSRGVPISELRIALPRIPPDTLKSVLYLNTAKEVTSVHPKLAPVLEKVIEHSISVSVVASYLSLRYYADPNEAAMAGLLHDVGKLAILKELDQAFEWPKEMDMEINESTFDEILPSMHERGGEYIARNWLLPETICTVVSQHHMMDFSTFFERTPKEEKATKLTALVSFADTLTRIMGYGKPLGNCNIFDISSAVYLGITGDHEDQRFLKDLPAVVKQSLDSAG